MYFFDWSIFLNKGFYTLPRKRNMQLGFVTLAVNLNHNAHTEFGVLNLVADINQLYICGFGFLDGITAFACENIGFAACACFDRCLRFGKCLL